MEHNDKSMTCVHCMYCGMSKGTYQAEVIPNSEKTKPVAPAVVKLHFVGHTEYPEQRRRQESVTKNAGSCLMSEETLKLY